MGPQNLVSRVKTIGARITLASGFLILLAVVSGYIFLGQAGNYRSDAETVTTLAKRTTEVYATDVLIYKLVRAEKDFVLTAQNEFKNQRTEFSDQVDEGLNRLIETSVTDESKALLTDLKARKVDYDQNFEKAVGIYAPYIARGGFGEAIDADEEVAFREVKDLSLTNTDILIAAETNFISKIVAIDVGQIESTLDQAQRNSDFARNVAYAVIAAGLIMGFIASFFVIRSTTRSLRSIVERLVSLAGILRDSASQATEVANQNATTATQLASSTTQQAKQVEEITTTISQTAAAISGVASLAQDGSASANKVNELAQKGGEGAEKAALGLDRIGKIVTEAVNRIRTLATSSREVGVLADEVTSIADQTNILALNAAIEAARAGDAGRGFAVVADEVRRLAESSRAFADQITKLINSVVEQAQQTAQSTSEGAKEITENTDIINASLGSFKSISDSVTDANAKIQEISANISQQAQSAEQISRTAISISKGIEQNTSGARALADAVDQQKVVTSVIEKSLEEAQLLLDESRALVGLRETQGAVEKEEEQDREVSHASEIKEVNIPRQERVQDRVVAKEEDDNTLPTLRNARDDYEFKPFENKR
jgi:methyl-accepting chemotaxis protein